MTSVSQSGSLLKSFLPMLRSFKPLALVHEKAMARMQEHSLMQSRVADLVHAEIIPRLACAEQLQEKITSNPAAQPYFTSMQLQEAAKLIATVNESSLMQSIDYLLSDGMSIEDISHEIIAPIAQYLGEYWVEDELSFTQVTLGCGRLQNILHHLTDLQPRLEEQAANALQVLLVAAPDEQHRLGMMMVAEAFRRDGWQVTGPVTQPDNPGDEPLQAVKSLWFDVVAISVGCEKRMPWLTQFVSDLRVCSRNPALKILVGGGWFNTIPDGLALSGADGTAREARLTPGLAKQLLADGKAVNI